MWTVFDNFCVRRVVSFFLAIVDFRYWGGERFNSTAWDKWLWKALDGTVEVDSKYTALVSGVCIWYENHPYSCGEIYEDRLHHLKFYPTILTRYKLKAKVKANTVKALEDYLKQKNAL